MRKAFICLLLIAAFQGKAQDAPPKFQISGTMGVTYEGYGLNRNPSGWTGYMPRRPWNQVRFNFSPTMKFGKDLSIPFNFNFAAIPTNFAGPFLGITHQTFGQFITNPMNNFGINPKYKWAELQLGTQYLKYSDLSTGDIGAFGAGFDLKPKTYRIKFFTGISQQGINFFGTSPGTGAYKRTNWMFQLGKEEEGKYNVAFNFAKGKDIISSIPPPPPPPPGSTLITPEEGFVVSLVTDIYFKKTWYLKLEGAQSIFTTNLIQPLDPLKKSFKPFIEARTSTQTDYAAQASIGKRSAKFDIGLTTKYLGAGFKTTGYPYMQPDRLDYTVNTRFVAWKNKMNVVASIGQRVNNISNTTLRAKQFIGNLNWFTQFDDHWSLNVNYNNFGFQSRGSISNPFGIKNVSNDMGINPTYTWSNKKMSHLLSLTYNYSKYDEKRCDIWNHHIQQYPHGLAYLCARLF